ncbi:MAG: VWA domain-containing protein [Pseudomonadota bacterium]
MKQRRTINSFIAGEDGTVAVFAALLITVLMGFTALLLDYGKATNTYRDTQDVLDAALLAAALAKHDPTADPEQVARNYIAKASAKHKSAKDIVLYNFKEEEGALTASAATASRNAFRSAAANGGSAKTLSDVSVSAKVVWGTGPARIALVLDNTYSMVGTKMDGLRTAAADVVTALEESALDKSKVKISVVPFTNHVRLEPAYFSEPWLLVPPTQTNTWEQCTVTNATECTTEATEWYNDGVRVEGTRTVCNPPEGVEPIRECSTATSERKFQGCLGSQDAPHHLNADLAAGNLIPGLLGGACPQPMHPLSSDFDAVRTRINAMNASGDTYIPSGLIWGWRMLSENQPFAAGEAKADEQQILILMTDGANERSPTFPEHNGSDKIEANTITAQLCDNIKAANIELYTVAFDVTDPDTETLLSTCASSLSQAYTASDATELSEVFQKIGRSLTKVRLAG